VFVGSADPDGNEPGLSAKIRTTEPAVALRLFALAGSVHIAAGGFVAALCERSDSQVIDDDETAATAAEIEEGSIQPSQRRLRSALGVADLGQSVQAAL